MKDCLVGHSSHSIWEWLEWTSETSTNATSLQSILTHLRHLLHICGCFQMSIASLLKTLQLGMTDWILVGMRWHWLEEPPVPKTCWIVKNRNECLWNWVGIGWNEVAHGSIGWDHSFILPSSLHAHRDHSLRTSHGVTVVRGKAVGVEELSTSNQELHHQSSSTQSPSFCSHKANVIWLARRKNSSTSQLNSPRLMSAPKKWVILISGDVVFSIMLSRSQIGCEYHQSSWCDTVTSSRFLHRPVWSLMTWWLGHLEGCITPFLLIVGYVSTNMWAALGTLHSPHASMTTVTALCFTPLETQSQSTDIMYLEPSQNQNRSKWSWTYGNGGIHQWWHLCANMVNDTFVQMVIWLLAGPFWCLGCHLWTCWKAVSLIGMRWHLLEWCGQSLMGSPSWKSPRMLVCLELELVTLDSDLKAVECEFLLGLRCKLPQLRSYLLASGIWIDICWNEVVLDGIYWDHSFILAIPTWAVNQHHITSTIFRVTCGFPPLEWVWMPLSPWLECRKQSPLLFWGLAGTAMMHHEKTHESLATEWGHQVNLSIAVNKWGERSLLPLQPHVCDHCSFLRLMREISTPPWDWSGDCNSSLKLVQRSPFVWEITAPQASLLDHETGPGDCHSSQLAQHLTTHPHNWSERSPFLLETGPKVTITHWDWW